MSEGMEWVNTERWVVKLRIFHPEGGFWHNDDWVTIECSDGLEQAHARVESLGAGGFEALAVRVEEKHTVCIDQRDQ
jgi:hypothetical protein